MRLTTIAKIREICIANSPGIGTEIEELLDQEERAEQMAKNVQELIFLANVTSSFVDMKPDHPLYPSVQRDVQASLDRLKNRHKCLPEDG